MRPSEPLVKLVREAARRRGWNTAALARAAGIDRARLKHVLAGSEPMTVDELVQLAEALELGPADLGLAPGAVPAGGGAGDGAPAEDASGEDAPGEAAGAAPPGPRLVPVAPPAAEDDAGAAFTVDPYGNHAEQAMRLGFALGCDIHVVLDPEHLSDSGIPRHVLARWKDGLPIRLDAAWHHAQAPRFHPEGLEIRLSFDTLYTCLLPWEAFRQVTFLPLPPAPPPEEDAEAPPEPGVPHLRLVE